MYFSPTISFTALWLIGACALCVLAVAAFYFFRVRTVVNYRRRADGERPDKPDSDYLPASVIIYSQGDAENLHELLEVVLNQDYPAAYEVIVVNEGEASDVRDTVGMLRNRYPNLYLTFTPEGVVNLSRKKLALTLGIKAARYDVAVLTTTAATVTSPLWLRRMTWRFDKNSPAEVVLGFAAVDPGEDSAHGCRRRAFDFVAESVRWLSVAIAGKPFRGTEYNIAYRRSLFLKNKGFARSLNLHYGDDDIFISEIANRHNTQVELSDDRSAARRQPSAPVQRAGASAHIHRAFHPPQTARARAPHRHIADRSHSLRSSSGRNRLAQSPGRRYRRGAYSSHAGFRHRHMAQSHESAQIAPAVHHHSLVRAHTPSAPGHGAPARTTRQTEKIYLGLTQVYSIA